jgi:hypothetical protein
VCTYIRIPRYTVYGFASYSYDLCPIQVYSVEAGGTGGKKRRAASSHLKYSISGSTATHPMGGISSNLFFSN